MCNPVVVRWVLDHYALISDAYVDEYMHREGMEALDQGKFKPKEFEVRWNEVLIGSFPVLSDFKLMTTRFTIQPSSQLLQLHPSSQSNVESRLLHKPCVVQTPLLLGICQTYLPTHQHYGYEVREFDTYLESPKNRRDQLIHLQQTDILANASP